MSASSNAGSGQPVTLVPNANANVNANANGKALDPVSCPNLYYLNGFDAAGQPICAPLSTCGGTQLYGAVLKTVARDITDLGRLCGQSNGTAISCVSCKAQWMYGADPSSMTCSCL